MSDKRMCRWQIPVDDEAHEIRAGGPVLAVGPTEALFTHMPAHWVEFWTLESTGTLNSGDAPTPRVFRAFGTGQPIPDGWVWRGTCDRLQGLVWHLFERCEEPAAGVEVRLEMGAGMSDDELVRAIRRAVRRHGGDARTVFGGDR